jgi:hypothetical protein
LLPRQFLKRQTIPTTIPKPQVTVVLHGAEVLQEVLEEQLLQLIPEAAAIVEPVVQQAVGEEVLLKPNKEQLLPRAVVAAIQVRHHPEDLHLHLHLVPNSAEELIQLLLKEGVHHRLQ